MYPRRLLIVLGVSVFMAALVLHAPARLVLLLLPAEQAGRVSDAGGTLWRGQATLHGAHAAYRVGWDLQLGWLLVLGLGGDWTVSAPDLNAQGRLVLHPWRYRLDIERGAVAVPRLNRVLAGNGATVDQPVTLNDISISVSPRGAVRSATGDLAWGPGVVRVRNRVAPLALPALQALLSVENEGLHLEVSGAETPGEPLAILNAVPAENTLHLVVLKRAAALAGMRAEAAGAPDSPFVDLRQPLR